MISRYLSAFFAIALLISSCKDKDPEVDLCKNGFKNPGEEKIDCGGVCPDCPVEYLPYFFLKINNKDVSYSNRALTFNSGQYTMSCQNDSSSFVFNLGSNGAVGTYTMNPVGTSCTYKNENYSLVSDGQFAISSHDQSARRMSGFFEVKFSRPGNVDTLFITNGQFQDIPY